MNEKNKSEKLIFKEKNFTWITINNPDAKSIEYLKKNFKFHHLDLDDCLSETQRPKIDEYDNYLFIILHVPVRGKNGHIKTSELHTFIGQNFVITLHDNDPTIELIFNQCKKSKKKKEEYLGKGSGYLLYMIIDELFAGGFPLIDEIGRQISELEKEVFDNGQFKDRLKEILFLKKDLINFRRTILPQRAIIAQLEHKNKKFLSEKLEVYFDNIVDKIEKMWNSLENLTDLVTSIQETNESIISHNTNNIIKILTVFSVVILPLTLITGFYGMNIINLPFAQHPESSLIIIGIIALTAFLMIGFFKLKKWI